MSFDAIVALVVLAIMLTILFGLIWWARGAPAYDDGRASSSVSYVAEPDDPRRLSGSPDPAPGGDKGTGTREPGEPEDSRDPDTTGGPSPDR